MFEVSVEKSFAAGHALRGYRGKCENVHGHNYKVRVTLTGAELDATGLLCDFVEVKRRMETIIERLDHQFLNDLAPFDKLNPSAENLARYFYQELQRGFVEHSGAVPVRVGQVQVWETDTTTATYRE
ncbi:MAG TPA: 6-carboxytetrahydropterin synthase QueD [Bryobacterales bacterium]|nr:6-carboxytetrahydropterin synthase QueD [Bryobacterales bacterium]